MYTISQASVLKSFVKIKSYLPSLMGATLICELADEFCEEGIEDPESFSLLLMVLEKMEESHELCAGIALYFEIQLHVINGIFPDLYQCIVCGNTKTDPFVKLDLDRGGALCSNCSSGKPDEKKYPVESLFVLEKASTTEIGEFLHSEFDKKPFLSAKEIISRFTSHYLRKELKSRRMFESALKSG
jgi:DNA repair protein RecO (recombination protein O)